MPEIVIKEILERDKEYSKDTDFTDVEPTVSSETMVEVSGPTATVFSDRGNIVLATVLSDSVGPSVESFSDVVYNITKTLYVTNINSMEFGFVPFNDTITYEE